MAGNNAVDSGGIGGAKMIDLSKIAYRLTVMDSGGKQYNIKEFVTGLGWEENKNEISVRTSFTAKNDKTSAGRLSELIKPGCLIGILRVMEENRTEKWQGERCRNGIRRSKAVPIP